MSAPRYVAIITDGNGKTEEVKGAGVVGKQPLRQDTPHRVGQATALVPRDVAQPEFAAHQLTMRRQRSKRERFENRHYTSQIKTYFRRLEVAVTAGDDEQITAEFRQLVSLIDKAVKRGALHRNTGARKKSRAARLLRGDVGLQHR